MAFEDWLREAGLPWGNEEDVAEAAYTAGQRAASEDKCGCEACAEWERVSNTYQALLADVERELDGLRRMGIDDVEASR